jgi:formate dehydrogenase major subunit
VAELLCTNSGRERTTCIAYALGWTQHTTGVQIIRTAGILQLLLGNVGRPSGGIMALRGHSTIQGATDVSTLYGTLPGYLPQPAAYDRKHEDLSSYIEHEGMPTGYWSNFSKFIVSHAATAPMAQQGLGSVRRLPVRRLVSLQPGQAPQAALRRLDRSQGTSRC